MMINQKRQKHRSQIRRREIQAQMRQMRREVQAYRSGGNMDVNMLNELITKSVVHNHLLPQIRQNQLLEKLKDLIAQSNEGQVIQLVLRLIANVLQDDVNLDEKEALVKLSLQGCRSQALKNYQTEKTEHGQALNLTCMSSILHNFSSICSTFSKIDQQVEVDAEGYIVRQIASFLKKLTIQVACNEEGNPQQWNLVGQLFKQSATILQRLLYCVPQEKGTIQTRFKRTYSSFIDILEIHNEILKHRSKRPEQVNVLHEGLLQVQEQLIQEINIEDYPMYFQDISYTKISIEEIIKDRNKKWTKIALNIIHNLLYEYQEHAIFPILDITKEAISQSQRQCFFRRLLIRDNLVSQRLGLIHSWLCDQNLFEIFEPFFKQHWQYILDVCCEVLKQMLFQDEKTKIALKVMIRCSRVNEQIEQESSLLSKYLHSIGADSLLQNVSYHSVQEQKLQNEDEVTISDMCDYLLNNIRKDAEQL